MKVWMVRSGSGGRWADECKERGIVGMGWSAVGDPRKFESKLELQQAVALAYRDYTEGQAASAASQLWRFRTEVRDDDFAITYDSGSRTYHFGQMHGPPTYVDGEIEELSFQRPIHWYEEGIGRDSLGQDSRNRLGSTLTLFLVPDRTAIELRECATGMESPYTPVDAEEEEFDPYSLVSEEAALRISDVIADLDWREMQQLVGALLRAMNYKTEISPDGPDRGKDIIASPDGFGFEQPRIVVEVKHRRGEKMDSPALRAFVGGRHKDDRGLYVSTGGFTKDAYYEADRSNIPLKLMTLDDLSRAVIENYGNFDSVGRALVPLKKMYWPA